MGLVERVAIVGADKLSPIRGKSTSSLLFADGACAVILGRFENNYNTGILASHTGGNPVLNEALKMRDRCTKIDFKNEDYRIKRDMHMDGYVVYDQARFIIPDTFFKLLKIANLDANQVKYLFKHQASEKILSKSSYEALRRIGYEESDIRKFIEQFRKEKVPKSIHYLGNSSVATTGTLLDIILKKKVENPKLEELLKELENYKINEDDIIALLSVGAGLGWAGQLIKMCPIYWDYLKN